MARVKECFDGTLLMVRGGAPQAGHVAMATVPASTHKKINKKLLFCSLLVMTLVSFGCGPMHANKVKVGLILKSPAKICRGVCI